MMKKEKVFATLEERLPQLPESLRNILRLLNAPGFSNMDILADAIETDPQFRAIVLENMNSPFYEMPHPVNNLRYALVFLGFEAVRNFMGYHLSQILLASSQHKSKNFTMSVYWDHALATSIAAYELAGKIGADLKYKLFTYGLLHDVGILMLEACLPEELDEIVEKDRAGLVQIVAERSVLGGLTHGELGGWLFKKWNLPQDIINVVSYHHFPKMSPSPSLELDILYLGNILGTGMYEDELQIRLGENPVDMRVADSLGLTKKDLEQIGASLDAHVTQFKQRFIVYPTETGG